MTTDLTRWIGTTETMSDVITGTPYAALSATLDRPAPRPEAGTMLPPLWHWLYFLPLHRRSEIGLDGHAHRGGFLPPVALPRRMWAGGQLFFHAPLLVGDAVTRTSTIAQISEKTGRTGSLVFVKVRHDFRRHGEADIALTEFHDIVFRDAPGTDEVAPAPQPAPEASSWESQWVPDAVLLFRYSALTFNGHRIHYDRRYATEVEGYPGLVVHGPLIATLLLDLIRRHLPRADLTQFEYRAVRPLFDTNPFFVCGEQTADGKGCHLWAKDHDGSLAMDATAQIAHAETKGTPERP